MSTAATPASNAPPPPYGGHRRLQVGRALLPTRYAACGSWWDTAIAIGRDLLTIRRSDPQVFREVTHRIAETAVARGGAR